MRAFRQQILRPARLPAIAVLIMAMFSSSAANAQSNVASNQQQAAQVALQQTGGGKVLGVSTETDASGRQVFAVKVLSGDGRVRVVRILQKQ